MNFGEKLKEKIIIYDGAMGTEIVRRNLPDKDFGGKEFRSFPEILNVSRPDVIEKIHLEYLEAGADVIETNTFGLLPSRLEEVFASRKNPLLSGSFYEISSTLAREGVKIAKSAIQKYTASKNYDGRQIFIAASCGPSGKFVMPSASSLKRIPIEQLREEFYFLISAFLDASADIILFETQQDLLELKTALIVAQKAMKDRKKKAFLQAQVTVEATGKMQIFNTDIVAAAQTAVSCGAEVFGINCSLGPDLMEETVKKISSVCEVPFSVLPNAGLPSWKDGVAFYDFDKKEFAGFMEKFALEYGANIVGGCCGTRPEHIVEISKKLKGKKPVKRHLDGKIFVCGPQNAIPLENFIKIGERLNVRGSRKIRQALEEGNFNFGAMEEIQRTQLEAGIQILDVCLDSNIYDVKKVFGEVFSHLLTDFPGAYCIDSSQADVLAYACEIYPGRPILNSISLEGEKLDEILRKTAHMKPLYIALLSDSSGPARTREEKLSMARKIAEKCVEFGVSLRDIFFDIGIFPLAADAEINSAVESLEAIPLLKKEFPGVKTIAGVGNLSIGFPLASRKAITSVFVAKARAFGLDAVIINPDYFCEEKFLSEKEKELARRIIFEKDISAVEEFSGKKIEPKIADIRHSSDPIETIVLRIKEAFSATQKGSVEVNGFKWEYDDEIVRFASEALRQKEPLEIISEHLIPTMNELGEKFATNEISLPRLLKSANLMKQVMDFFDGFIKVKGGKQLEKKGKIVLGTVYQDVHTIGKDLTKTIFENWGWEVIDLGSSVPVEKFVEIVEKEKPFALAMSSLLVQSSLYMIEVCKKLDEKKISIPILIGGASVNKSFAARVASSCSSPVFYCLTAMDGVQILEKLSKGDISFIEKNREELLSFLKRKRKSTVEIAPQPAPSLARKLPTFIEKIALPLEKLPINKRLLHSLNWRTLSKEEIGKIEKEFFEKSIKNRWIEPVGICGIFRAKSNGKEVTIFDDKGAVAGIITGKVAEKFAEEDFLGLQIVTAGKVTEKVRSEFEDKKDFSSAYIFQGLANRVAEDTAEYVHRYLQKKAGVPKSFRYSPGYPALGLENNEVIFRILGGSEIGIELTEGFLFVPLAATAAVVSLR